MLYKYVMYSKSLLIIILHVDINTRKLHVNILTILYVDISIILISSGNKYACQLAHIKN